MSTQVKKIVFNADVQQAALALNWGWPQAPIYAVLDRLAIEGGLDRNHLTSILNLMASDPNGPYGQVLMQHRDDSDSGVSRVAKRKPQDPTRLRLHELAPILTQLAGEKVAKEYDDLRHDLPAMTLDPENSALFIIDPQRSFTQGAWMHSMGPSGEDEVQPIRLAFQNAASILKILIGTFDLAFSRCPFPPDSYDWDPTLEAVLPKEQTYFINAPIDS